MKKSKLLLVIAATFVIGQPAFADERSAPDQSVSEQAQMMQKMQTMRKQMTQIHATDDAEERNRLLLEHMQNMRGAMMMMSTMNQSMMQPGSEGSAGSGHQHGASKCTENSAQCKQMNEMTDRHSQMELRMGMMQMMMQQMLEHSALKDRDAS